MDLVILDLDGTLYSSTATTIGAVTRAVGDLNERHGTAIEEPTGERILSGIGFAREDFVARVFPELAEDLRGEMSDLVWRWEHNLICSGEGSLFPGAVEALDAMAAEGKTLAVATNAGTGYMNFVLDYFAIRRYFRDVRCAESEGTRDKSRLIDVILSSLGADARAAVMVGDRMSDIDAGLRSGTRTIGCTWGFGTRRELEEADAVVDRFPELPPAVRELA